MDVFQLGVAKTLGKLVDFSQARAPSRTDAAEVRPCLPKVCRPMERNERQGTVKERHPELLAVRCEVVRQLELLRRRRPSNAR